jgi:CBS domain-containing protein
LKEDRAMRAKDIMASPVVTVKEDTSLKAVASLLLEHDISAVPVLNVAGQIVGIVSDTDLISLETEPSDEHHLLKGNRAKLPPKTAGEAMTRHVSVLGSDTDVSDIARDMLKRRLRHIPIVEGNSLVGMVSRRDLLRALARSDLEIRVEVEELLDDELLMIHGFRAEVENGLVTLRGPRDAASRQLVKLLTKSVPGVIAIRFEEPAEATAEAP